MGFWIIVNLITLFPEFGVIALVVLLVLIAHRVQQKRKETFEKRDH